MKDNDDITNDVIYHIIPIDDIKPHQSSPVCPCQPRREVYPNGILYSHNSWDGREITEQAIEYLDSASN